MIPRHGRCGQRLLRLPFILILIECGSTKEHPKNSFLPALTAIAGVIATGNSTVDMAMQLAVSYHLQGWFHKATQQYAVVARLEPTNLDVFLGAAAALPQVELHSCP